MQKITFTSYNFNNEPLSLVMIIFGVVAMVGSLAITIRELPKAKYPHYMMSDLLVSEGSWWTATITWGLAYNFYSLVVVQNILAHKTMESDSSQIPLLAKLYYFCCLISSFSIIGLLAWGMDDYPVIHRFFGSLWGGSGTISTGIRVWCLDDASKKTWGNFARKINFYGELTCALPIILGMTVLHSDDSFFCVIIAIMEHVFFIHLRIFANLFSFQKYYSNDKCIVPNVGQYLGVETTPRNVEEHQIKVPDHQIIITMSPAD